MAPMSDAVEAARNEGNAERLRRYWLTGKGSLAIRWNTPGDFTRCVRQMREHAPSMRDPEGYCAELHKEATGVFPGDKRNVGKVSASENGGSMPSPEPSRADLIRSAYNASGAPESRWIVEIDDAAVVVIDDTDRSLHRIPVEVSDAGVVFGSPTPVRMAYVPSDSELVAASRTVFASREESRPEVATATATVLDSPPPPEIPDYRPPAEPAPPASPPAEPPPATEEPSTPPDPGGVPVFPGAEPEPTEPKEDPVSLSEEMRSRLGLADDADEAAALAAIDALKTKADTPTEPSPEQVAASAAKDAENVELRAEVKVLASRMEQVTAELAATKAEKAATVKASVLDDAAKQGKFSPADRVQWEKDYDEAPAAVTRILASIAPGTAVPVAAAGYAGTGEEQAESFDDAEYQRLFGEKAGA